MRLHLAFLLLGLPGAAMAAEDRYGATRTVGSTTAPMALGQSHGGSAYGRAPRRLTWPGQVERTPTPVVAQPTASQIPEDRPAFGGANVPASQTVTTLQGRQLEAAVPRAPVSPPAVSLPRVSPPRQETVAASMTPTGPASASQTAAMTPPVAPLPAAQPPLAASNFGYGSARAYSVVREFGGSPDRIAAPPPQSAFRGRTELTLLPEIAGGLSPPAADIDETDETETPSPVRSAPKDKR